MSFESHAILGFTAYFAYARHCMTGITRDPLMPSGPMRSSLSWYFFSAPSAVLFARVTMLFRFVSKCGHTSHVIRLQNDCRVVHGSKIDLNGVPFKVVGNKVMKCRKGPKHFKTHNVRFYLWLYRLHIPFIHVSITDTQRICYIKFSNFLNHSKRLITTWNRELLSIASCLYSLKQISSRSWHTFTSYSCWKLAVMTVSTYEN